MARYGIDKEEQRRLRAELATLGHADRIETLSDEADDVIAIWCAALKQGGYEPDPFPHMSCLRPGRSIAGDDGSAWYRDTANECAVYLFYPDGFRHERLDLIKEHAHRGGVDIMLDSYYSGVPASMIVG